MGEEMSKPEGGADGGHGGGGPPKAETADQTPAQKYFGSSLIKCTKRTEFPLMEIDMGDGKEYKYMDTRGSSLIFGGNDQLHMEMFWTGEKEGLDEKKFKEKVGEVLSKYGAVCEGGLREAGCMISMLAYPFAISEEDAMRLGRDMFSDFENPPEDK